jgi:hypothetical protein
VAGMDTTRYSRRHDCTVLVLTHIPLFTEVGTAVSVANVE